MKKQMLVASLCLILGLAVAPAYAQADEVSERRSPSISSPSGKRSPPANTS